MSKTNLAWKSLKTLAQSELPNLTDMFENEADREQNLSYKVGGLYVDFSKQKITKEVNTALMALAKAVDVEGWRTRMFAGEKINVSEGRAVLHPTLRGSGDNAKIKKQVQDMRAKTREFAEKIRHDRHFKAVLHIGIGGSDLGTNLCSQVFAAQTHADLDLRFVVNVDGASINEAVKGIDPKTTLVIIVSKSFTTQETRMNGEAARAWLGEYASTNMVAISANNAGVKEFGVAHGFEFWDWVGGRFSLWSAVSLSLQICYGSDIFDEFLSGAFDMDQHFTNAPLNENLPVMMALTSVWNRNFIGYHSQAVIPYSTRLGKLPAYLQQLEMESNGKGVQRDGQTAKDTSPVIWGDEGTNSQHAFFQYLHQSNTGAPVDFIAVLEDAENRPAHHKALLANCFAQSEALMVGNKLASVEKDLRAQGLSESDIRKLAPQKFFSGNRPSTTILLNRLDARILGQLIALYEHKVFVQSIIWKINAFDQWGVELGKVLAGAILPELSGNAALNHDSSTNALIALARESTKP
ncbi:MAG: glucose-6-phosphate isomerase [Robiginitomaculum sp.]